jgi:dihydropyrimidine dehydrogenase (NAD+) subunit PreA
MADLRTTSSASSRSQSVLAGFGAADGQGVHVVRAFRAGWGGVVWKTLGEDPPIVNTCSRYGALHYADDKMIGFNNIELITRPAARR